MSWDCAYIVCGREVGDSGTPHLQGYIYYKNAVRLSTMKEVHPTAHWEPQRGTPQQASDYCKKEGDFYECGNIPMSQQKKGEAGAEWWKQQVEHVAARRYDEVDPQCLIQNFSGLHKAASVMFPPCLKIQKRLISGIMVTQEPANLVRPVVITLVPT